MLAGLIMAAGTLAVGSVFYGIGRIHGYDKWDKENEEFQKGLNKRD